MCKDKSFKIEEQGVLHSKGNTKTKAKPPIYIMCQFKKGLN